ncbi:hypothetical protein V2J09_003936, partial [Rumex salicifolius]
IKKQNRVLQKLVIEALAPESAHRSFHLLPLHLDSVKSSFHFLSSSSLIHHETLPTLIYIFSRKRNAVLLNTFTVLHGPIARTDYRPTTGPPRHHRLHAPDLVQRVGSGYEVSLVLGSGVADLHEIGPELISMGVEEENQSLSNIQPPNPSPKISQPNVISPLPILPKKMENASTESIRAVASRIAVQPLPVSNPDVWGVLTAISNNARKRVQGINMLLSADGHCIGRVVEDTRFRIDSTAVSQRHCQILRRRVAVDNIEPSSCIYEYILKDSSTNGTFINWERLKRGSSKSEARLHHGDIISLAAQPHIDQAFAFVFREVMKSIVSTDGGTFKRKADDFETEGKRFKGIGIGASEGPISLDDFRSLQRSNMELRKQFEENVITIDSMQKEKRTVLERHENEMKELKESISRSYVDQLKELNDSLEHKRKELEAASKISAEQKHVIDNLKEGLASSLQSCAEANEIMKSQKASLAELKTQLDEERDQRREEREKAAAELKAAVHKAQLEGQEELKRLSDASLRREREQQEVLNKLQESEKESSSLVESLRTKLENTRQKLVLSDNKVRQLESHVLEEQQASASRKSRVEELEVEIQKMKKELQSEKAAREEAWSKVSALELEINAAMRDLDFERRRLKGARERIMLRETQLRSFYSTTEEIKHLFSKQQEQLKAMQRTLEDEENCQNTSTDLDLNSTPGEFGNVGNMMNFNVKPGLALGEGDKEGMDTCSDNVTEKHDEDMKCGSEEQNTQEAEFPNDDCLVKGGFGSDIDGVGTAPIDGGGTEQQHFPETESPGNLDQTKSFNTLAGDTMQLEEEDDTHVQETEPVEMQCEASPKLQSEDEEKNTLEEDTPGGTIRTADLLASEVVGSWNCSTAPSLDGENECPNNNDNDDEQHNNTLAFQDSNTPDKARDMQALSEMIAIVAPDLKDKFGSSSIGSQVQAQEQVRVEISDSDTEDCTSSNKDGEVGIGSELSSDAEVQAHVPAINNKQDDSPMGEEGDDDDDTQEDSIG